MRQLPGGGYIVDDKPMPPLRPEYGGDGRTLEDALGEAKAAKHPDHVHIASLQLAQIAEKHKARLEALGYEIVVEEPEPPTQTTIKVTEEPAAKPKRKVAKG